MTHFVCLCGRRLDVNRESPLDYRVVVYGTICFYIVLLMLQLKADAFVLRKELYPVRRP